MTGYAQTCYVLLGGIWVRKHGQLRLQKGPGRPKASTAEGKPKSFDFAVLDEHRQIGERKQVGVRSVPKCFQDYVDFYTGKTGEVPSCQRYPLSFFSAHANTDVSLESPKSPVNL